jgi:hypothetical protein
MIIKIKKMLFCLLAIQILFITFSAISNAATCSNNWLHPSSQTMETEIMYATLTKYANGEYYFSIKQKGENIDIYFLMGARLVKGLDDSEINYDKIPWIPTVFAMPIQVLLRAVPQGPCSVTQKITFSLPDAEGEITSSAQGVITYRYTATDKKSADARMSHVRGMMQFTPPLAAPSETSNISGYKLVGREKPYPVIGSKDMPMTTIGKLRRELCERQSGTKKWTGPVPEIVMAQEDKGVIKTQKELYPFKLENTDGFVDKKGQVVVETPCIIIGDFYDDIAICTNKYFKRGFINREGKVIFEPEQGLVGDNAHFSEGLAAVKKDKKIGFIDKNGKFVIEPQFSTGNCGNCEPYFSEGLARVGKDMKWGFIDKTGKFVVEPQFERVWDFHEGLAAVTKDRKKWGFINKQGEYVIQPQFDITPNNPCFSEGLVAVKKDGKWGSVNKQGEFVIKPQFDYYYEFHNDVASIRKNDIGGFIDKTGKYINVSEEYKSAGRFHDGLSQEKKNGKYGYIDKSGEFVIEPQFEDAGYFRNGVASVRKNGKWGLIDKLGQIFVFRDKVCGHEVIKNGKGEITWPNNIKELCGKSN